MKSFPEAGSHQYRATKKIPSPKGGPKYINNYKRPISMTKYKSENI